MKLPKTLLTAMLVAVTAGTISSCEKPNADATKKTPKQKTETQNNTGNCPACGMG